MSLEPWIVGLHMISWHWPGCHDIDRRCEPYHNANVGVYARAPSGLTFGGFTNSYGRASAYGGWTFESPSKRFALTTALASGYPNRPVQVMVVPSVRFELRRGLWLRAAGGPRVDSKGAAVLHMTLEWQTGHR